MTMTRRMRGRTAAAVVVAGLAAYLLWPARPTGAGTPSSGRGPFDVVAASRTRDARTGRQDLARTVEAMRAALRSDAGDGDAAVRLADALLRQTRVTGNGGLALEAESALRKVLGADPADYDARRMLAAVLLSQHRFTGAIREAERCRDMQPRDAWPYGVIGDARVELGDYDEAFDAFDRMLVLRPDAGAYARASYARELQGDLTGAVRFMQMAVEATSPHDPEAMAWHRAQLGHLRLQQGELALARREYQHAEAIYPGHPFAAEGLARVDAAEGRFADSLARVQASLAVAPTPGGAALAGDLLQALGRTDEAGQQYALAEAAWRVDAPEPARLIRFLAERGRDLEGALRLAEGTDLHDIFTDDARAWASFKAGRLDDARRAMARALRTGSRDRVIRYHAAAIAHAAGDTAAARRFLDEALGGSPRFDLVAAPEALALRQVLAVSQVARQ